MARERHQDGGGTELGRFLYARRTQVTPADVGLIQGSGVRRTPGLRREEVATLAGVSIDYYTRLERGKETRPSPAVVDALARALKLDSDEHEHLRALAARAARYAPEPPAAPTRTVRPQLKLLLETLRPNPGPDDLAAFGWVGTAVPVPLNHDRGPVVGLDDSPEVWPEGAWPRPVSGGSSRRGTAR